jgi:hypothetical protein
MLARTGIGSIRIADPDCYEPSNLNRQLFATVSTLGRNKAEVAKERVHDINPFCNVTIYTDGVHKQNAHEFVRGSNVTFAQSDTMSPQVLLDRVGRELQLPILKGSRAGYPGHRWEVGALLWDYRNGQTPASREEQNDLFSKDLPWADLTDDILKTIDQTMSQRMREKLSNEIRDGNAEIFGESVTPAYLQSYLDDPRLCTRTICGPLANMGGLVAAIEGLKIVLGWKNKLTPVKTI